MGESVTVRPMRAAETETVLELWLDLVDHHRQLDPAYPASRGLLPALRRELARALREPRCRLLVAESGGELCGFLLAQVEREGEDESLPGVCWIHELYVDPQWRRRGVGSHLVSRAEEFFSELGAASISVRVEARNRDGQRFWERRGFGERARILERPV